MILKDKNVLICNLLNKYSIGWGIAQVLMEQGARIFYTYQTDRSKKDLAGLFEGTGAVDLGTCDVTDDADLAALWERAGKETDAIHGLVHTPAFAPKDALGGRFVDTKRDDFKLSLDISAFSLAANVKAGEKLLAAGKAGVVALTYLGGERAVTNYNLMGVAKSALDSAARYLAVDLGKDGIRVNLVSPGPIKTMAARGIKGFTSILDEVKERTPLKRNVDAVEVGKTTAFLLSDLASGVTGELIHVDAGYHCIGL